MQKTFKIFMIFAQSRNILDSWALAINPNLLKWRVLINYLGQTCCNINHEFLLMSLLHIMADIAKKKFKAEEGKENSIS